MQETKPICYLPHEYESGLYEHSFYKHMFIEDISHRILPYSLRDDDFEGIINCSEDDLPYIKKVLNCFSDYSENHDISRIVTDAIRGLARDISWSGKAIYEIYGEQNEIRFIPLKSDSFIDMKFFELQLPPKKANKKLPLKFIKKKYLWKISIPKELQRMYIYKNILSSIDKFDSSMPKVFKDRLYNGDTGYGNFDLDKYKEKQFLYVNDLTREWGWNQRSMGTDMTTEFFKNFKQIKFDASCTILREHIINELNKLFIKLNKKASIEIKGIPSSKDYEIHLNKYVKNEVNYDNIFDINIKKD